MGFIETVPGGRRYRRVRPTSPSSRFLRETQFIGSTSISQTLKGETSAVSTISSVNWPAQRFVQNGSLYNARSVKALARRWMLPAASETAAATVMERHGVGAHELT